MTKEKTSPKKKQDIIWASVLWSIHLHVLGLYATWLLITTAKWMTLFFTVITTLLGCLGVTVGAHRLWAHRTFKASWSLRLFLMLCHTLAGVGPIYDWVLYHRLHHKYYGTDKDPYNHKKGFWYSHYVSNVVSPNVDYDQAKIEIDMRDMDLDGFVLMQKKLYWLVFGVFGILLPLNAPLEYWDEAMGVTILTTGLLRFAITMNTSWLVNSGRIIWGTEGNKVPPDGMSVFFVTKTYWPLYHYIIPWDWKSGEFGSYGTGCSMFFIKMWYELGFIDDLQTIGTAEVREILHTVAKKKMTLDQGIDRLKEYSELNAQKEKLLVPH